MNSSSQRNSAPSPPMKAGVVSPDGALALQRVEPGPLGESTWLTAEFHHHVIILCSPNAMRQDTVTSRQRGGNWVTYWAPAGEMLAAALTEHERESQCQLSSTSDLPV